MPEWTPEIDVDADLARRLVGTQFPEVDTTSLEAFGEGWDNVLWLTGGGTLFRFPRREMAAPGVARELAVLPVLAGRLPLAVPAVERAGKPDEAAGYPWPFFGGPPIPGRESGEAALTDDQRAGIARPLGEFLHALHAPATAEAVQAVYDLPVDPNRRADMGERIRRTRMAWGDLQRLGLWSPSGAIIDVIEGARMLRYPTTTAVVHGDLHFRHLLIEGGRLSGVIDWGDTCLACPAIDLPLYWSFFPPSARAEFLQAYGPVSDQDLVRARVLALWMNAVLALYGHQTGKEAVVREAVGGLRRASVD
ncbi:MAG TPA: phosphotransferase [Actinomycetota bacterium]|nr:phosphotransferase [Actinomycetota bacterium]